MKQNHHTAPPACDRSEEIRREAERAIRECDTAADLTDRILSQPIADRLAFIDRAEAYYTRLLSLRQREALVDHFDQREPKFGDLTDYFRFHREEAKREQSSHENETGHRSYENENRPHIKPADAVRRIALQKKASEPKQPTTPNTQINMTINNYGGTQNIFEAGATQHIERLICTSAPEQVSLPEEEGTTNEKVLFLNHESSPICTNEAEEGMVNGACGDENELKQIIHSTSESKEQQARRFLYFSREATEKDRREFEDRLTDAAPRGNRYVVDLFNSYSYYLDLRGIRTTDLHREMQQWGLTSRYDAFQKAMLKCRCIR